MMRTRALVSTLLSTLLAVGLVGLVGTAGCKTKEVSTPDPNTQRDLDACKAAKTEKDKLIAALQDENAKLQVKRSAEVVVVIEGPNISVKPGQPGEVQPIDTKVAEAGAKEFNEVVEKSRGSIQKCYEQALKKKPNLGSQTTKLTVEATFSQAGVYQSSSSSPPLGEPFDGCIRQVAQKWTIKQGSPSVTFRHRVNLMPL